MMRSKIFALYIVAISLSTLGECVAGVHPFHLSTAEIEMNAKTGRVEIALKIHGSDLERALTAGNDGKRVSIGEDTKAHAKIQTYLDKHFVLAADVELLRDSERTAKSAESSDKTRAEKVSHSKVVGTEFRDNWLWIYFELELPSSLSKSTNNIPWQLRNTLLLDIVDAQINTISVRNKNGRFALRSSARTPVLSLPSDWLDPSNAVQREN